MAKKQLTPEEYQVKSEKSNVKKEKFGNVFMSSIAVMLALVITFSVVSIAFTYVGMAGKTTVVSGPANNDSVNTDDNVVNSDPIVGDDVVAGDDTTVGDDVVAGDDTTVGDDTTASDDTTANDDTTADNNNAGNNNAGNNNAEKPTAGATDSKQEALDIYKKAVANARTKSTSVIRVKDGAINYKGIVEAGALSSVASTLMGMFMAKDEASIKVKNENWKKSDLPDATALTLNGIQKITCEDKGNTYVITVVAKNATNPKANADGVGAISGVIEESQITGAIGSVPGLALTNINIVYENVTTVATVDKATGNLLALNLNAPCVLGLDAKLLLSSIEGAKVGIQVITEYKISY